MRNELSPNQGRPAYTEKTTEPHFVAYTRFRGILNAPSRIWMVRDWAKTRGYHLVGPPCCLFYPNGADAEEKPCEVQWQIAEAVEATDGEVGTRWSGPTSVVATYHLGQPTTVQETVLALGAWGQANGYRLTGTSREVYHFEQKAPREHWITEIQLFVDGKGPCAIQPGACDAPGRPDPRVFLLDPVSAATTVTLSAPVHVPLG